MIRRRTASRRRPVARCGLAHLGHQVHIAHSGAQALETASRVHPQIVVLDIGMPDMSGYQVAERIRVEAWGKDVTLVAVTGWGQEEDKRRALAAGFDHHMTKPIDPVDLGKLIDGVTPDGAVRRRSP